VRAEQRGELLRALNRDRGAARGRRTRHSQNDKRERREEQGERAPTAPARDPSSLGQPVKPKL
jgi:hypothetical protein